VLGGALSGSNSAVVWSETTLGSIRSVCVIPVDSTTELDFREQCRIGNLDFNTHRFLGCWDSCML
jgi:hypothetical protein